MKLIDGTPEAMKLINELKVSGDLIDVYSEEYFKKRNDDEFDKNSFQDLIKKHGDEFTHHLLVGCFHNDDYGQKLWEFLDLYDLTIEENRWDYTCDCLVFINLKTQSILYMGITGRKRHFNEFIVGDPNDRMDDFEKLDYLNVVGTFRNIIADELAYYLNQLYYGEYPDYYYEYVLGKNNLYHHEYDVDSIETDSDEGLTKEELDEYIEESEAWVEGADFAIERIRLFFPKFDRSNIYE